MSKFPYYHQHDQMDCGPTLRRIDCGGQICLRNLSDSWRMVAKHHGRHYSMDSLRQKSGINREGGTVPSLRDEAVEETGFNTVG